MSAYVLPVGAFVCLFRDSLEADPLYSDLWLEGEITDLSQSSRGHVYFSLRDPDGLLRCVMFRRQLMQAPRRPRVGDQVAVHGGLSVYSNSGSLQIVADLVTPAGQGAAALELEYLRQRLEQEGIFDASRKRRLPAWPRAIGVVTSRNGAAWQDIQSVIARRYPLTQLLLAHAQVQGQGAVESLVTAIELLQYVETVDVIIVARGGGSNDDLSAFNDEAVVRAVFASHVPVVTGVGHATDRTLVEAAADLAAPTPSAAAELCVPSQTDLGLRIGQLHTQLAESMRVSVAGFRSRTQRQTDRLLASGPQTRFSESRREIDRSCVRLDAGVTANLAPARARLHAGSAVLEALSPAAILDRGFAAISLPGESQALHSINQGRKGARARARVADGEIDLTLGDSRAVPILRTVT
ncbi:MAG: exodeoxyribonuclease VII large subunit [Thermomicrobiales bacterium]|nr:exodeoxyribonuclease VII large subunit [Thermomicrobiales bacterium]